MTLLSTHVFNPMFGRGQGPPLQGGRLKGNKPKTYWYTSEPGILETSTRGTCPGPNSRQPRHQKSTHSGETARSPASNLEKCLTAMHCVSVYGCSCLGEAMNQHGTSYTHLPKGPRKQILQKPVGTFTKNGPTWENQKVKSRLWVSE